jgi:hypothetical protein
MGVSGKWFKALVGLKKSEKSQSLDKEENVSLFIYFYYYAVFLYQVLILMASIRCCSSNIAWGDC